jgi:hypothetical protein
VDGLHQDVLVLELVTLGSQVELVIEMSVDLLGISISLEETSENTDSADVENLGGKTGVSGTLAVTVALVTTLSLLGITALNARARVNSDSTSDNKTVLEELADVLA